jgi:hypothetical protein
MNYRRTQPIPGIVLKVLPSQPKQIHRLNIPTGYCQGGFRGGGGFNSMDPERVRKILQSSSTKPKTNKTKTQTKTSTTSTSIRRTTDLRRPLTKSGKIDKRFKNPEFCNKDGTRDKRCTQTAKR